MSPDEPLTPAPPRYTPEHHYDPVPVRDPGFKEIHDPPKPGLAARVAIWFLKRAARSAMKGWRMRLPTNWRTVLSGLVALLAALAAVASAAQAALDGNPNTVPDWGALLSLLGISAAANGVGNMVSKSSNVTGVGTEAKTKKELGL